jgi:hypothetical protein
LTRQHRAEVADKAASVLDSPGKSDFAPQESGARGAYDALQIVRFAPSDQVDATVARLETGARRAD